MEIGEILEQISAYQCRLVEITGGEPLLQPDTPLLIQKLLEDGYEVLMETNGSFDISRVDRRCMIILDIKCPSSGENDKNDLKNLNRLRLNDQVKFVIGSREDYKYAKEIITSIPAEFPLDRVLLSPVSGKMPSALLARWILKDKLGVRLHLQLHKIIWPEASRGV